LRISDDTFDFHAEFSPVSKIREASLTFPGLLSLGNIFGFIGKLSPISDSYNPYDLFLNSIKEMVMKQQ